MQKGKHLDSANPLRGVAAGGSTDARVQDCWGYKVRKQTVSIILLLYKGCARLFQDSVLTCGKKKPVAYSTSGGRMMSEHCRLMSATNDVLQILGCHVLCTRNYCVMALKVPRVV